MNAPVRAHQLVVVADAPPPDAPPMSRRDHAKAATRAKACAAARGLFRELGYERTTIRAVAAAMGMSTGAIFTHFKDKAELWTAAVGGPAPTSDLAAIVTMIRVDFPAWSPLLRLERDGCWIASLTDPDWCPLTASGGHIVVAAGQPTPEDALRLIHRRAHEATAGRAGRA